MELNISQLKNEIQKGLRSFNAFKEAEAVLSKLEGMEQEISQKTKKLEDLKASEGELAEIKQEAINDADNIVKSAMDSKKSNDEECEKVLEDAKSKASKIVDAAKEEVKAFEITEKEVEALKQKASELDSVIALKRSEVLEIDKIIEAHQASIDNVIASHKESRKKFLRE